MSREKWRESLADPKELRKTFGGVFDGRTIQTLLKMLQNGKIASIDSVIKEGKESKVLAGHGKNGAIAIKIYAVEAANFKRIQPYLEGDPRFKGVKSDRASIIRAWATREFKNLQRATEAGVSCPEPIAVKDNVLIISFIGELPLPAPRLTESEITDPQEVFDDIIRQMRLLWNKAGIVHGDLSAYNVLLWEGKPWLIDFSQAVVRDHPSSITFLERDIKNIVNWAKKVGAEADTEKAMAEVTKPF